MTIPLIKTVIPGVSVVKFDNPVFAQVDVTSACQYRCQFCYNIWKGDREDTKGAMTREQAFFVADTLSRCRVFSVILSGGEPTLVDYLEDLVARFTRSEVSVSMITNGAKLRRAYLLKLHDAGLSDVQISMHHYNPKTCDRIAGREGAYEKTLMGIHEAITVLGTRRLNVNMVVTSNTVNDVQQMGAFLLKHGVTQFSVSLVSTSGQAARDGLECRSTDLQIVYDQLVLLAPKMDVSFVGGMPFCALPDDYDHHTVNMSNFCDAGIEQVVIGPNGGIRPCVETSFEGGNIFEDNLTAVWTGSEVFNRIRRYENVPPSCHSCCNVARCHGGCRASALCATGDLCGYDPMTPVAMRRSK